MTLSRKLTDLLDVLLEGTRKGRLAWRRDSGSSDAYDLKVREGTIRVAKHPALSAYAIVVFDGERKVIDETEGWIRGSEMAPLAELHTMIHGQFGGEKTIQAMIEELRERAKAET